MLFWLVSRTAVLSERGEALVLAVAERVDGVAAAFLEAGIEVPGGSRPENLFKLGRKRERNLNAKYTPVIKQLYQIFRSL